MSKNILKENKRNILEKALKDFSKAKSLIDICIELIEKFDRNKQKLNNITKNDLNVIQLKINVREEIIKKKNKNFFQKLFTNDKKNNDEKKLRELYNKYIDCPSFDLEA